MRRGRPPHDDILTPREWEVLALLREGLTNAQIASRLGISERGAKYHVLEIISKLGVSNRREASQWRPDAPRRQWSFASILSTPLETFSSKAITKVGIVLAASLALGLFGIGSASIRSLIPQVDIASFLASGTNREPSLQETVSRSRPVVTGTFTTIPMASWDEAQQQVDFHVLQPKHLPEGFSLQSLVFSYFPGPKVEPPTTRNGMVAAVYTSQDGWFRLEQGWGWGLPHEPIRDGSAHGEVQVGKYTATWIQGRQPGGVGLPLSTAVNDADLRLGWFPDPKGVTGPGWKITTNALPLDDLKLIAASLE